MVAIRAGRHEHWWPTARRDTWYFCLLPTRVGAHTKHTHGRFGQMVTLSFLARFRALTSQRDSVNSYTKALVSTPLPITASPTLPNETEVLVTDGVSSSPPVCHLWSYRTTRWWSSRGISCVTTSRSTSYWRPACCRTTPSWRRRTSRCRSRCPCSNRAR